MFELAVAAHRDRRPAGFREDESWTTPGGAEGDALSSRGEEQAVVGPGVSEPTRGGLRRPSGRVAPKRQAQRCGSKLEPETSREVRSRAGRSLKTDATDHRGSEIQRLVAADGKGQVR